MFQNGHLWTTSPEHAALLIKGQTKSQAKKIDIYGMPGKGSLNA